MQSNLSRFKAVLLPVQFKKIGLGIIVLTIVFALVVKMMQVEIMPAQRDLRKVIYLNFFLLGLSFVAFSRDKTEDEMTVALRLKAIACAFGFEVLFVILSPFIDLLFKEPVQNQTGQNVVLSMLLIYLMVYYGDKIAR